jgi:type VI secretion system protein ImpC
LAETPHPEDWRPDTDGPAAEAWQLLRQLPEARYLGLVLPRFLLRLPYGRQSDPVDGFHYGELTDPPRHEDFLWANGTFVIGCLLGEAFCRWGWKLRPDAHRQLGDLPLHTREVAGRVRVTPCAEAWLDDRAAQALLSRGLMPLQSVKNRDEVLLSRFQSIAAGSIDLAGGWQPS